VLNRTVTKIIQRDERIAGVELSNGEEIESPVVNRPGNSGGSPAWERGWNHGQEAGWTEEVSV